MLELNNVCHMTALTILFESGDKLFYVTSWTEIMTSYHFLQNTIILRRLGIPSYAACQNYNHTDYNNL